MLRFKNGYTLIEIASGLSIISIFVVFILSQGHRIIDQAREEKQRRELARYVHYCEQYYLETGEWPSRLENDVNIAKQGRFLLVSQADLTLTAYPKRQMGQRIYGFQQQ